MASRTLEFTGGTAAPRRSPLRFAVLAAGLLAALAAPRGARAQTETFLAQQRYDAGLRAYEAGDLPRALEELRASLALVPSPNTRLMIARTLRNSDRLAEALMEYELAAREAADRARADPRYEPTRVAAEQERDAIRDRVGHVRLSFDAEIDGLVVRLGRRSIPAGALTLAVPVDVGEVVVTASAPGHARVERRVTVAAGEETVVAIELTPLVEAAAPAVAPETIPPAAGPSGFAVGAWTATAIGLAAVGVGVGLLVAVQTRFDGLVERCGDMPCPADLADQVSEGRALEAGFWVMVATAGTAALVALVTFLLDGTTTPTTAALRPGLRF